jgi:effector-binding domain-containing protein
MDYIIVTHDLAPQTIASIRDRRTRDELPAFLQAAIPELFGGLSRLGIIPSGPPFVIYHDFSTEGIDAEAAVPIGEQMIPSGKIESRVLPAMTVARTIHVGPYEKLGDAYAVLRTWVSAHGYEVAGPFQERYLNGPGDVTSTSEYRTEIEMPIVPSKVAAPA